MRKSIVAPRGKTIVVCDSSNIEARVLDALAGKADALEVYRNADSGTGPDVYCVMAQNIYGYPVNKKDHPSERQMGKIAKLGLGYGMGSDKFVDAVRTMAGMKITKAESKVVVDAYRNTHREVTALWKEAETALAAVVAGGVGVIGKHSSFGGLAFTQDGIRLPNGTRIQFPKLHRASDGFAYLEGTTPVNIYGGKVIENVVQALARIIVVDQILDASDEAGVPYCHMVHDEGLWVVDEDKADWMLEIAERHMRTAPKWWPDIPLNSEGSCARSYGDAK
jgi:DNA polymerase